MCNTHIFFFTIDDIFRDISIKKGYRLCFSTVVVSLKKLAMRIRRKLLRGMSGPNCFKESFVSFCYLKLFTRCIITFATIYNYHDNWCVNLCLISWFLIKCIYFLSSRFSTRFVVRNLYCVSLFIIIIPKRRELNLI